MVHAIISDFLTNHFDATEWPFKYVGLTTLQGLFTTLADKDGYTLDTIGVDGKYLDAFLFECGQIAVDWFQQVFEPTLRDVNPLLVERELRTTLTSKPQKVVLVGTPDLVTPGTVFDWKVAGRGWDSNKDGLTKGNFSPQPPLYLHLVRTAGLGIEPNTFVFYVYDVRAQHWEPYETTWTDEQITAAVQNAKHAARMILNDAFQFTPFSTVFGKVQRGWWCSAKFCGAWPICQGKRMINDGADTEVVRDPRWVTSPEGEDT